MRAPVKREEATTVTVTERERMEGSSGCEREPVRKGGTRDRKRVSRNARTCMRLGNALIGLSDSFRVAPYPRDRFRFDKIEFHLTRVEYRERSRSGHARILALFYFNARRHAVTDITLFYFFFSKRYPAPFILIFI